jgi:hypothetical protein
MEYVINGDLFSKGGCDDVTQKCALDEATPTPAQPEQSSGFGIGHAASQKGTEHVPLLVGSII